MQAIFRGLFILVSLCICIFTSAQHYKRYPKNFTEDGLEGYFKLPRNHTMHPLKYSFAPKPVSDVEIDAAIDEFLKLPHPKPQRPLLCTTFTSGGTQHFNSLLARIISIEGECDWAVLVYRANASTIDGEVNKFKQSAKALMINIVLVEYSGYSGRVNILHKYAIFDNSIKPDRTREFIEEIINEHEYNTNSLPKPILISNLIPIASNYEYVWIMDDDIWPIDVNVKRLLLILKNAFTNPLYVAQPLVWENTQRYPYFNWDEWKKKRNVIAQETGFIEIQMPIFHGLFLEFYLRQIVARYLWPSHITGLDFGIDNTFCPVAELFAMKHIANSQQRIIACGAITELCVRHTNKRSQTRDWNFGKNMQFSISSAIILFPEVRVAGLSFVANPFRNSKLETSVDLKSRF